MNGKKQSSIALKGLLALEIIWITSMAALTLFNLSWSLTGEISIILSFTLLAVVPISGSVFIGLGYVLKDYTAFQRGST